MEHLLFISEKDKCRRNENLYKVKINTYHFKYSQISDVRIGEMDICIILDIKCELLKI